MTHYAFTAPAHVVQRLRSASVLSARELLSKLEGDERDELQRAMKARDFDAVRVMLARYRALAVVVREQPFDDHNPMMRRAWGARATA